MMFVDDIHPFVRFAAVQNFKNGFFEYRSFKVTYDHRIYFCMEGKGEISINGVVYQMEKGDFLLFKPASVYKVKINDGEPFICATCNFDFFNIDASSPSPIVPTGTTTVNKKLMREENLVFDDEKAFNDTLLIKGFDVARNHMIKLAEEYRKLGRNSRLTLRSEMMRLIMHVLDYLAENPVSVESIVDQVIEYIEGNYKKDLTNKSIANYFGYHPNYISQIIKNSKGASLHQYIIKLRLAQATRLLSQTRMSITQICEEININDPKYFARLYKKYYGVTPTTHRKLK